MLVRLARSCYRRRRLVVLAWVLLLVGLVGAGSALGSAFDISEELPGSESQEAADTLERAGFGSGERATIVFEAEGGVDDPAIRSSMEELFARVSGEVADQRLVSPYEARGETQISDDGTIAFAELEFDDLTPAAYEDRADQLRTIVADAPSSVRVELGGGMFVEESEGGTSEAIGLVAAIIILLLAFGSLLAMGLPIATALLGVGCGVMLTTLLSNFVTMPEYTVQLTIMLGIGVGIDYALFIVMRFRSALSDGMEPEEAVETAMTTTGRAVLYAEPR